jgi:misacylated tRNA(Ala) deacylase
VTRLICQEDAYLRSVTTEVVACTEVDDGHAAVLRETVLYPEGGGQPDDHGTVGGEQVLGLRWREGQLEHLLPTAVEGQVEVTLDWSRRYDHMQQHTAQHLLTAVAQDRFGWATCAFHLGVEHSDIELDRPDLPPGALDELELQVNAVIREDRPVTTRRVALEEVARLEVRTRGLPDGLAGPVRLVAIEGIDLNTCGGTHVARTAELQTIQLVGIERMRGGTRLYYLAGGRVQQRLGACLERESALSERLSCGPVDHVAAVDRLQQELRESRRVQRAVALELAGFLGRELARQQGVACLHRPEAEMELLRAVARAARAERGEPFWALITGGEREGLFLLLGPPERLAEVGPAVADLLGGRGGGSGELFQGKAERLDRREQALDLLLQLSPSP